MPAWKSWETSTSRSEAVPAFNRQTSRKIEKREESLGIESNPVPSKNLRSEAEAGRSSIFVGLSIFPPATGDFGGGISSVICKNLPGRVRAYEPVIRWLLNHLLYAHDRVLGLIKKCLQVSTFQPCRRKTRKIALFEHGSHLFSQMGVHVSLPHKPLNLG